ncbi:procyclic acidic repetitive family protein [Archangium lansingense]|uniref:Procyclic acidic repetitive family protein n=1 Tax=Archangium lansingense TaxID=2995310 RepID=A0ABT4A864_9BACT|nr:procyclic acidic repetitive family protein [Archangium lansinium]MCY1077843.1 procyclic acidic repetitive family protein [Archangium lansinium]
MDDGNWINCPHCGLKHRPRAQSLCPRCGRTSTASRASSAAIPSVPAIPRASAPSVSDRAITPVANVPAIRVSPVSTPVAPPPAREPEYRPNVEYIPSLEPAPARQSVPLSEPEPEAAPSSGASTALAVAGAILLGNAVLHLFEFLFLPSVSTNASLRAAQLAGTLVGMGLDAFLGISFLRGKTQLRPVAFVRLVVGMFLFGGMSLYQAQYLFTLVVFAFSCGTLVLVWGKPSSFLAGVGLTAVLLSAAVELIGFNRLSTIQPLSDRARIALRPDLEGRQLGEAESIVGERHPYKLRVPSNGWYRRKGEVARTPDGSVDLWLSQPEHAASLLVAVHRWNEAETANLKEARDLELRNLRVQYPDFQLAETSDNGTPLQDASVATLTGGAARNGKPFLFEVSLYKTGDKVLLVTAFAPTGSFELLNLQGATTSLRPD